MEYAQDGRRPTQKSSSGFSSSRYSSPSFWTWQWGSGCGSEGSGKSRWSALLMPLGWHVIDPWRVNNGSANAEHIDSLDRDASWTCRWGYTNIWEDIQSFSRSEIILSLLRACRNRDVVTEVSITGLYVQELLRSYRMRMKKQCQL